MEDKLGFNIEEFIDAVDVKKNENDGDCEYEVSEHAKEIYGKYPAYLGCSKNQPIEKNGIELTADILTSIKTPINEILRRQGKATLGCKVKGSEIKQVLLDRGTSIGKIDIEGIPKELLMHIKMFAFVYYWCGNMMPVISNWCPGSRGADTWKAKINKIIECFECQNKDEIEISRKNVNKLKEKNVRRMGQKRFWLGWIKSVYESSGVEVFVNDNFLQDMVFECDEGIMTKDMLKNDNNLVRFSAIERSKNEILEMQEWLDNVTDLIIRRSYRIVCRKGEEFSSEDNVNIEMIKNHIKKLIDKHER